MKERFPATYNIQITNTCMAKCYQCNLWENKKSEKELNTKEKLRLIEEIQNLKGTDPFYIHFSGGEPFLKKEEIIELANFCKQNKIRCGIDSTGYYIDEAIAKQLSETTLNVHISFDSMTPAIHDEMRRLANCHQRAVTAIDNLIKYLGNDRVFIRTVISKKNLDEIEKLIQFADEKKIDSEFVTLLCDNENKSDFLTKEYWPDNKRR